MERAAVDSGGELAVGFLRLRPRLVRHDERECVQTAVVGGDALKTGVRNVPRRELAGAKQTPERVNGQRVERRGHRRDR